MVTLMYLYFGEASIFLNVLLCVLIQKDIFVIAISLVWGQKYFLNASKISFCFRFGDPLRMNFVLPTDKGCSTNSPKKSNSPFLPFINWDRVQLLSQPALSPSLSRSLLLSSLVLIHQSTSCQSYLSALVI